MKQTTEREREREREILMKKEGKEVTMQPSVLYIMSPELLSLVTRKRANQPQARYIFHYKLTH